MVLLPSNTPEAPTPTPVAEQAKEYSILKITEVTYQSGQVKVFGRTDLPDGAILMMHLEAPTGLFAGLFAQGESKVENGEFTMVFDTKPYEVSALLTPVNQPDSVSRLVGDENEVTFKIRVPLCRYNDPQREGVFPRCRSRECTLHTKFNGRLGRRS